MRHQITAYIHRHDDFFQRGITGAFANAVNRAFDLAGTGLNLSPAGGNRQPKSLWQWVEIMALSIFGTRSQHRAVSEIFLRHGVAHCIRNIDRRRAGLNRRFHDRTQENQGRCGWRLRATTRQSSVLYLRARNALKAMASITHPAAFAACVSLMHRAG
ncbi:MAG: hypothetical protein CM15mP21_0430 [Hyphomicrobiales bacterium]|nr:MAG: hypothetical protein CM15mP21_0430 [Hyphomicrobiales bacterium]